MYKPSSSEASCMSATAAESLHPLILGYLQTLTGLNWEVRVERTEIDGAGEFLTVRAAVNMTIAKSLIGSEPELPYLPPQE